MKNLTLRKFSGAEVAEHISSLADLRIKVFREYPYLYDGNLEYEKKYLQTYINSPNSILVLVFDKNKVVGATSAIPLADETPEFKKPFLDLGYDINDFFYYGESVLLPEYRGQHIGNKFFEEREAEARKQGFTKATFAAVIRPKNHPQKPKDWYPLNNLWNRMGFIQHPELKTELSWKEINEEQESKKTLVFWIKNL